MNLRLLIDEEQTILRKNTLFMLSSNIETTDETHKGVNFCYVIHVFGVRRVFLQTLPLQSVPTVLKEI